MVKRISTLRQLLAGAALLSVAQACYGAETEKHYRQAAWAFYLQQPAQALETLQLAPDADARTHLLEAGLYLQLDMPKHAAQLLETVIAQSHSDDTLPLEVRNIALLQFARYQLELGDKVAAKHYLQLAQQGAVQTETPLLGQQKLLAQLVNWPDITIPATPQISALANQAEMPYIISNQALALARSNRSEQALQWLASLQSQLSTADEQSFWQLLFSGNWRLLFRPDGFVYPTQEQQALADYIDLTRAQLHISRQEFATADAILSNFSTDSVLSANALELYSHILTEQRHIPTLLAVLQQQIRQQPFSTTAWQAATRIGEQLERAAQTKDALAAYHWADKYYQQQLNDIQAQARPLQVEQLADGASQWQQLQLSEDSNLFRLQQDILALQQQVAAAPQRQQRLARLADVTGLKLEQQQHLLSTALPQLSTRYTALEQRYSDIGQQIELAQQQPMAASLWQGEPHRQLRQVEQAQQRLAALSAEQAAPYQARLQRLKGLLHWQYQHSAAERRWQLSQQRAQLELLLQASGTQLNALQQQSDKTERLSIIQQRLNELSRHQQQLNLALLSKQQQLLAALNQLLQHRLQQQLAGLTELQRHNKEAMARVMEQVLSATPGQHSGASL